MEVWRQAIIDRLCKHATFIPKPTKDRFLAEAFGGGAVLEIWGDFDRVNKVTLAVVVPATNPHLLNRNTEMLFSLASLLVEAKNAAGIERLNAAVQEQVVFNLAREPKPSRWKMGTYQFNLFVANGVLALTVGDVVEKARKKKGFGK